MKWCIITWKQIHVQTTVNNWCLLRSAGCWLIFCCKCEQKLEPFIRSTINHARKTRYLTTIIASWALRKLSQARRRFKIVWRIYFAMLLPDVQTFEDICFACGWKYPLHKIGRTLVAFSFQQQNVSEPNISHISDTIWINIFTFHFYPPSCQNYANKQKNVFVVTAMLFHMQCYAKKIQNCLAKRKNYANL